MSMDGGGGVDSSGSESAGGSDGASESDAAGASESVSESVDAAGAGADARDAMSSDEGRDTLSDAADHVGGDDDGDDGDDGGRSGAGGSSDAAETAGGASGAQTSEVADAASDAVAATDDPAAQAEADEEAAQAAEARAAEVKAADAKAAGAGTAGAIAADMQAAEVHAETLTEVAAAEVQTAALDAVALGAVPTAAAQPAVMTGAPPEVTLAQAELAPTPEIGVPDPRTGLTPTTAAGVAALATGALAGVARDPITDALDRAAVAAAAETLGVDPTTVEGYLAAEAHAWADRGLAEYGFVRDLMGMANPAITADVARGGPAHQVATEAIGLHELGNLGDFRAAVEGDPAAAARAQAAIDGALAAHAAGLRDAPQVVERASAVDPALSTMSNRARAAAAANANGMQNWQAHHVVPFAEVAALPPDAQRAIADAGWAMDAPANLIALPADQATFAGPPNNGALPQHAGAHANYSAEVARQLSAIRTGHATMTPQDIAAELGRIEAEMLGQIADGRWHDRVN